MQDSSCLEDLSTRRETYYGISIDLPTTIAKEAKARFVHAAWAQDIPNYLLLRDDNAVSVYFYQLDEEAKDWLHTQMSEAGLRATASTLSALRNAEKDPANATISNLEVLTQVISEFIKRDAIDGWLYSMGTEGERLPWLVTNVTHQEMSNGDRCVGVHLLANTVAMSNNDYSRPAMKVLYFFAADVRNKKVADLLATKGFMKETPELKAAYEHSLADFVRYVPQMNKQFIAQGCGLEVDMNKQYHTPERLSLPAPARVINDEGLVRRTFFTKEDTPFWRLQGLDFSDIPMHPMVLCFNLETHTNMWIHVDNLAEYQYDPSLRDKLVLPPHHRDLIDILTQDMDVLMDDIVSGKSGGTTILCKGAPGLGKTLTAEVYAEVVGRPLYRVHSGQLGIHSEEVEKNLEIILKRAQRWGAVMLLDEADVYIRRRGNDIDHNAVVAAFLRTLEYFHGLLFMTTNRTDDVDDAISSRCIATIRYEAPKAGDAKRIWQVLSNQFQLSMSDELYDQLVA
ncbi:MAG: AAA family ATPase, partial [Burkholderiaceae bacterium]|nr:AAA family ATPase [Burkholderiaceae bacterium]